MKVQKKLKLHKNWKRLDVKIELRNQNYLGLDSINWGIMKKNLPIKNNFKSHITW